MNPNIRTSFYPAGIKSLKQSKLLLLSLILIFTSLGLVGCGGDTNPLSEDQTNGDVIIGLTDAPGDFQTYTVDVVTLTLTKANGDIVETLPLETRVDFSQYTEMTEFLTAATIPSGIYTQASMKLDYSNADIQVEDESGVTTPVTQFSDEDGNAITQIDVKVQLEGRNRLLIKAGIPANLTLDFDLKASNQVIFDAGSPSLIIEPFLVADIDLEKNKTHRLRGALKTVNLESEFYTVIMRPFHHKMKKQNKHFGELNVNTNDETVFEINQVSYKGVEGLSQLSSIPALSATVAVGEIKLAPRRFEATHVYAGSSVPGGDKDVIHGNVIKRVNNTITVKGATLVRKDGTAIFRDMVTVQLADTTSVNRQHDANERSINDISVGQRVRVFGSLESSDPTNLSMDASNGHVALLYTTIRGTADTATELLSANLTAIDRRKVGIFDFSGTGLSTETDANPNDYEIETGLLDLSFLNNGSLIKARGFVRPFGQAPADFEAQTIVKLADKPANLGLSWRPATATPFLDLSDTQITLNLDGQGRFHHLAHAGHRIDLNDLAQPPVLQPTQDGKGRFSIHNHKSVATYATFPLFVEGLNRSLKAGKYVGGIKARGIINLDNSVMKTNFVKVQLFDVIITFPSK